MHTHTATLLLLFHRVPRVCIGPPEPELGRSFHVVVAGLPIDFPVQMTISLWVPMFAFSDLCTPIPLKYLTRIMETLFFSYLRSGWTFNFQCSDPSNGSNSILCVSVHVQVKYTMTCVSPITFTPCVWFGVAPRAWLTHPVSVPSVSPRRVRLELFQSSSYEA